MSFMPIVCTDCGGQPPVGYMFLGMCLACASKPEHAEKCLREEREMVWNVKRVASRYSSEVQGDLHHAKARIAELEAAKIALANDLIIERHRANLMSVLHDEAEKAGVEAKLLLRSLGETVGRLVPIRHAVGCSAEYMSKCDCGVHEVIAALNDYAKWETS